MYEFLLSSLRYNRVMTRKVFCLNLTSSISCEFDLLISHVELLLSEIRKLFPDFQYFYVVTSEGNGVVHLLLVDVPMPTDWFKMHWVRIHDSYVIRFFKVERDSDMSYYLSTQNEIVYFDCSEGFVSYDFIERGVLIDYD